MIREEKLLLLDLILQDIRGNWGWDLNPRVDMALSLATELNLPQHVERINGFIDWMRDGYADGRHFRTDIEYGGYEGMSALHGLSYTYGDKSDEFKLAAEILTYPEYRFDDWSDNT